MIRNKYVSVVIASFLFAAMTLSDSSWMYLEEEDLLEIKEGEREEELEEESKGKHKPGGFSTVFLTADNTVLGQISDHFVIALKPYVESKSTSTVPLFLLYCRLKIPHC